MHFECSETIRYYEKIFFLGLCEYLFYMRLFYVLYLNKLTTYSSTITNLPIHTQLHTDFSIRKLNPLPPSRQDVIFENKLK